MIYIGMQFMDNFHCPKCGGPIQKRKPSNDTHLIVKKEKTIRLWCPCGYYRDEIIEEEVKVLDNFSSSDIVMK